MVNAHAFLSEMNQGPCRRLRGNVFVELVFVEDQVNSWTKWEIDSFYPTYKSAVKSLCKQAAAVGTRLTFTTKIGRYRFNGVLDPAHFYQTQLNRVKNEYFRSQGCKTPEEFLTRRKIEHRADEVAMIFMMERRFRAYACNGYDLEFCVMTNENDTHAFAHELLHLFGAADLYYPYPVYGLTMEYFPQSVMCTYQGMEVDPLTRYLVGWENTLSPRAEEYLNKLSDYGTARHRCANHLEVFRDRERELLQEVTPFSSVSDLQRRAAGIDPWAEFLLGICYRDGIGVEKDPSQAEKYFRLSGITGLTVGAVAHAQMMLCRKKLSQADLDWLWLILQYNSYDHFKLHALRVAALYRDASRRQSAVDDALNLYKGKGLYKDRAKRSSAMYEIAQAYSRRIPELHRVVTEMRCRYDRMLKEGDPEIDLFIGKMMEEGQYFKRDVKGGFVLYERAASFGHAQACAELARCYRLGIGTARSAALAQKWQKQAQACVANEPYTPYYHLFG